MSHDSLGDRMKGYENISRHKLTRRTPVIMRLDGKAFHTLTRGFNKPFDEDFIDAMRYTTRTLMSEIMGATIAYVQSDEISIFLSDYKNIETEAWFDNNIQKMCSVAASMATVHFNYSLSELKKTPFKAMFDCRVFSIPKEEITNYFKWRQDDWTRNSVQMLARSLYSHKELHKKNVPMMLEMCSEKEIYWNNMPTVLMNGTYFFREGEGMFGNSDLILNKDVDFFNKIIFGE